jgi:peptidyl-prolyl cis-trans isomerase A (cyclophilin A)
MKPFVRKGLVPKQPFSRAGAIAVLCAFGVSIAACSRQEPADDVAPSGAAPSGGAASSSSAAGALVPLPGRESAAPALAQKQTIRMETTGGEIVVEVYPEAAPNAAQRFVELVASGFYDDTPISRVVPGFVAQFGVNWRQPHKAWKEREFNDDPTYFALERGTLAFAKAGPNTNSTQVFINYSENNRLADPRYNFTVFGKIVEGMDVVDKFVQVGDPSGGLDQERLWSDGGAYLESLTVKPTMIERATVSQ